MDTSTPLLIVGAGPFGLAMAAHATDRDLPHVLLGRPMESWERRMPRGMILRSGCDWHLDPSGDATMDRWLDERGLTPGDVEPLHISTYLDYAAWFQEVKGIEAVPKYVTRLDPGPDGSGRFHATLEDESSIEADSVVVAIGFGHFPRLPDELTRILPQGRFSHTRDLVDLEALRGRRCLIVGGRQSAFEWAALLREAGATAVHVCHRHPTPAFEESDWSWVPPLVDRIASDPGWFRRLSGEEKARLEERFWTEGRLKLEPWLAPRLAGPEVRLWPETRLIGCEVTTGDDLAVTLDCGDEVTVDDIILATGYEVDLGRIPFLAWGDLFDRIEIDNGYPVLDEGFQSSVPGLFFTSMAATRDFGPFFGFTVSVRASATVIGRALGAGTARA